MWQCMLRRCDCWQFRQSQSYTSPVNKEENRNVFIDDARLSCTVENIYHQLRAKNDLCIGMTGSYTLLPLV